MRSARSVRSSPCGHDARLHVHLLDQARRSTTSRTGSKEPHAQARVARIETSAVLVEALSLYRSTGRVEVPAFNDEPFADHRLEKALT
jgi:hypothetical protein